MKIVSSNKKEVVKLLNDLYKLKNTENEIKEAEIEECSTNFITKEFKTREADILYKIKNRNIFLERCRVFSQFISPPIEVGVCLLTA